MPSYTCTQCLTLENVTWITVIKPTNYSVIYNFKSIWYFFWLLFQHHCHKLFIVDLSVAIAIDLSNHDVNFRSKVNFVNRHLNTTAPKSLSILKVLKILFSFKSIHGSVPNWSYNFFVSNFGNFWVIHLYFFGMPNILIII